ncbi:FAD-dependent monooxygenase [bacterium]|nr:FAD-dependent monooxygenase [bacterium]
MPKQQKESVIIVGAGLVGSLLSIYLARKGFQVSVYERRPDMRKETISAGRSINLAISTRGIHALERVGLAEKVLATAIPMQGRMMHSVSGELTFQRYGKDDSEHINSISRGELNKILMTEAEKTYGVKFHFCENATAADFKTGAITFKHERTGATRTVNASKIFGTDGSASAIRRELEKQPNYRTSQVELSHGYKELTIPEIEGGGFQMERNALHIWPRGSFMLIALPNFQGTFTCTLFLPFEGPVSFASITDEAKMMSFFKEQFPDVIPLLPNLKEEFFENPTGRMVTVKSAPWSYKDRVVLLGDAAHAIVPFFGQGMNCGFEDCEIFDDMLTEALEQEGSVQNWEKLFTQFWQSRKPNSDAIADMAAENFVEMRDKVGDPKFLLMKKVEKILNDNFPKDYVSRYGLVTFSQVPYSAAYKIGTIQNGILDELCRDLKQPENLDLALASKLIQRELSHVMGELNGSKN